MRNSAFTLLELSIVIAIIGLIVAGISAGTSLVRQASLRSISSDLKNFEVALNVFQLQYDALPGDMANAHSYWATECATDADDCNGNGDNSLFGGATPKEEWMFWKHLQLANLIDGNFTGAAVGGNYGSGNCQVDENIPPGPIDASAYRIESNLAVIATSTNFNNPHYVIQFGGNVNNFTSTSCTDLPVITPAESLMVDKKIDDGVALEGSLQFRNSTVSSDCLTGGEFDLDNETNECRLFFSSY